MERFFRLDSYLGNVPTIEIGADASPWGNGGWLSKDGAITHYFAGPITDEDVDFLQIAAGASEGQQVLECLAVLVGVSVWADLWKHDRINLKARAHNVDALTLLLRLRPSSTAQAMIARELALHLIELSFPRLPSIRLGSLMP